ncbi:MAG TPA: phosphate ABC transporter permease subunit PstC [Mycobacteriales bacterium]|jgi:phosphate transport system permease protein|nr:phosphate ABC transporter permease subunit PstC [Mycobacteriales bacterium]
MTAAVGRSDVVPLTGRRSTRRAEAAFHWGTRLAGVLVFVILGAIAVFLVVKALPAFRNDSTSFWTTKTWNPDGTKVFGVAALLFGTVLSSALALLMAVPVALGVAIYITQYAPRRLSGLLAYATDMLAAVPSVIYGLWGLLFLLPHLIGLQLFLHSYLGWIPLFAGDKGEINGYSKSILGAAVILAIMILPIVAAIAREVLRQVDPAQREAALALGATRWEMIRTAVLPPSRPGIVSGVMLGLGRAMGETIAVALVIGNVFSTSWKVLPPGGNTIAANIANRFGESGSLGRSALIASGLVLFALTLAVNLIARWVIYRSGTHERSSV